MTTTKRRWWTITLLVGADLAITLLLVGALGTKFELWDFNLGFTMVFAAAIIAVAVLVLGIAGWVVANRRGYGRDKPLLGISVVLSAVVLAILGLQFSKANSVPPIHNISTDVDNPPAFEQLVSVREASGANPLALSDDVKEQQLKAYPGVQTLATELAPGAALDRAEAVLTEMGLEIAGRNDSAGLLEATATSFWFGFKDDVAVRVRAANAGSVVDLRSVSRVGQSDLGANAARIEDFLARF